MNDKSEFDESLSPLEEGLRAAFGSTRTGSVLARLENRSGSVLRLTLPDADEDREPVVKPVGHAYAASMGVRYQVLGEIARGGLGVVMKTRDLDLGRDVAVKVLHERYKDDVQVIERFVEEAQIGGQLQHPGIVPVYELGLQDDDRPFFAMKLVKGETLAAMLKKRRGPSEDLQRFLRVFLQVCQAVAYAHVRRVVHRDLKPSNIMVGAFGEVQVVDWGLAKVLRAGGVADEAAPSRAVSVIATIRSAEGSTHSIAGSVMGTPAYMPPEQARGEVELMDPRSDVFSLGAILCEVLSGEPPYDAENPEEALRAAAECRQEVALRRLENSGAHADLVELTRACLAPSQAVRPQDAGEVAKSIEAHLQSIDERARRAEVHAAELRVRTRSYLILAAVVLVTLIASGWTYFSLEAQRSRRHSETAKGANAAILEATRYAGQAQQAGLGGVALWQSAVGAAKRAEEIVAAGEADAALEGQVAELIQEVQRGEIATREKALMEASHNLLLQRLVEVRVGPDVPRLEFFQGAKRRERESARRAQQYEELFDELGFGDSTGVEEAAELFDCAHRERFALALDAWAEARRTVGLFDAGASPETWRRLVRNARRIDPENPWRNALRDELGRAKLDAEALRELSQPGSLQARSAEEIAILVALLDAAGDIRGALDAQVEGMHVHPADYWLNHSFISLCSQEELAGRHYGEVRAWSIRAALAIRPESRAARFNATAPLNTAAAQKLVQDLLREDPDNVTVQSFNFLRLMMRGRFDEAATLLPDVIPALQKNEMEWDHYPFLNTLGHSELLFQTPGTSPIMDVLLHLSLGRYAQAWTLLEANRGDINGAYSVRNLLPVLLNSARSAPEFRQLVERLLALADADESQLRATPAKELLAAAELVALDWKNSVSATHLFEQAFQNDPSLKDDSQVAGVRLRAASWAALASSGGTLSSPQLSQESRMELRDLSIGWIYEGLEAIEDDLIRADLTMETAESHSRNLNAMTFYGWLAPIREPEYLAQMEPQQAHECRVLWARIKGLEAMLADLISSSANETQRNK